VHTSARWEGALIHTHQNDGEEADRGWTSLPACHQCPRNLRWIKNRTSWNPVFGFGRNWPISKNWIWQILPNFGRNHKSRHAAAFSLALLLTTGLTYLSLFTCCQYVRASIYSGTSQVRHVGAQLASQGTEFFFSLAVQSLEFYVCLYSGTSQLDFLFKKLKSQKQ
jgi:hypothetical protein